MDHEDRRRSRGSEPSIFQVSLREEKTNDTVVESNNIVELPPQDSGFRAWSYVASAFSMYIVVWGFPQSFPIFQAYLTAGSNASYPHSIAIRLLAPGLQDIEEGLLFPLLPTSSNARLPLLSLGITMIGLSLLCASYALADWQIVLFQGVTFGFGGILMNFVHVSVFAEWFDRKKGLAMGIIWTGWRVGALAWPFLCQWLLDQHGFRKTMQVLIAPMLTFLIPTVLLMRGRYHTSITSPPAESIKLTRLEVLTTPSYCFCLGATCIFYLVVNVPKMFITTLAADLGLGGQDQAFALALLVLGDMMGTFLIGWLSDHMPHDLLMALLAIATALGHLLGLTLSSGRTDVLAYGAVIGVISGGFSNCIFPFFGDLARGDVSLFTSLHGLFSLFRGVAILSVGLIGAELLRLGAKAHAQKGPIDQYFFLMLYSVSASGLSGIMLLAKYIIHLCWTKKGKEGAK